MKKVRAGIGLLGVGLLAGCNLLTAAPAVSIDNPGTVTGTTVTVTINASGASGIQAVGASLNGVSLGEDREAPYTFSATVNRARNGINTLSGYATNTAGGFTYAQPVTFTVNIAPNIALVSSSPNINSQAPIRLAASAIDTSVGITKVEFYQGSTLIGTDTTSPYTQDVAFNQVSQNGVYNYTAKSFDAIGNTATSGIVPVTVGLPAPTISLTSSSPNLTSNAPATLTAASVSTNLGLTKVEFYQGTTLLGTDTTAPYTQDIAFNQVSQNGSYNYNAKSFDTFGNTAVSSSVAVTVNLPTPNISLTPSSPTITSNAPVTLTAAALSTNLGLAKVEFYQGSTLLGTDTAAPFTQDIAFNQVSQNGTYNYTAKSFDTFGNTSVSSAVAVSVNLPTPNISLTPSSPTITSSTPITLTAASLATDLGLAKVEFYQGTTLLGTDTSAPFTQNISFSQAVQNGVYDYNAKSFDVFGNTGISTVLPITVNIPDTTAPSVALSLVSAGATGVALAATASDDIGVTRVEFYNGSTLLGTDTTAPYAYTASLSQVASGFPAFTAKAFDAAGNVGTSSDRIEDVWENASGARNNSSANAVVLNAMPIRTQAGFTLTASLDSTAFGASDVDVDFYAVNMTFAQVLKVRTYSATGVDTIVRIYDANGNQLAFNDSANDYDNSDSAVNWRANSNGVYYIGVSSYTDAAIPAAQGAGKQYRMTVQVGD